MDSRAAAAGRVRAMEKVRASSIAALAPASSPAWTERDRRGSSATPDRHAHQALRQQIETVTHRQPGPRAVDMADQELGDEDIDLADAGGEGAGQGQADQLADFRGEARQPPVDIGAGLAHAPPQQPGLGDAGDDHAPGGGDGGGVRRVGRQQPPTGSRC